MRRAVPRPSRVPVIVMFALATVVALIVIVVARAPRERSYADLMADPAYGLRLPGSDDLGTVGGDSDHWFGRNDYAFAGHTFGVDASSAEVNAYFDRELAQTGWSYYSSNGRASTELGVRWYCKPWMTFRLGILDQPRALSRPSGHTTVYDARLMANSGPACP